MKHLYIVRHGQTVYNLERRYAGQSETPLTEQGKEDAQGAGQAARSLSIDRILSSPLSRALDTAKIIAQEIGYPPADIVLNDLLKERSYGHFEGLSWTNDPEGAADVEPLEAVISRARQMLAIVHSLPEDTILLVSHGTFAKAMRHAIDPGFNPNYNDIQAELRNGQIYQLI